MNLLHGTLYVSIFEAHSLPNPNRGKSDGAPDFIRKSPTAWRSRFMKRFSWIKRVSFCRLKLVDEIEGTAGVSKVYATIDIEKARVGRTRLVRSEPINPRWYESFRIYCAHMAANIIFTIKWDNPIGASLIGRAYLSVEEILNGEETDRWLEICDEDGNPVGAGAMIHVKLRFLDVVRDPENWGRGIRGPNYRGVPHTYFPQRQGCRVSLYQDSHVADNFIPRILLANGRYYEPRRCWREIFDAISRAQHLIYVTGWSVYADITLVRDPYPASRQQQQQTLGDLLKMKASQGVRVLMLVWDDRTSVSLGLLKKDGLMATHDQDTAAYFRGTDVHCVLCPRNPDNGESYVQGLQVSTMFTHHQKSLVVDSETDSYNYFRQGKGKGKEAVRKGRRKIVSFVGGIDLCDGRYDTQQHSLFRTLNTVHRFDFHQPNFKGASLKKGGPREPWHDVHCRLEGDVAWDVLYNFEQRWKKQGAGQELLLQLPDASGAIIPPSAAPANYSPPQDREEGSWNVQLFRSIDGGAASGFPEAPEDAARAGLVSGKDHVIERSIQDAYINAIRRARDFIYIENQYFLGSSYDWRTDDGRSHITIQDVEALHLIPKELSLKIVSKIEAGERFTVYVVIPMWPEGVPESASVQAILDWQRRTMEMMYADIALALRAKGLLDANPTDYLNFFCLGNREVRKSGEYQQEEQPEPNSDYSRAQQARRFMIYVHAKMMIVDDEYIIIGSANINQRSMDGGRDSEIAMGAYQPYHLASSNAPARGETHGFRLSLWYEHLGMLDDAFLQPASIECVQKMKKITSKYWDLYAGKTLDYDLPGHLLSYPIRVTKDGKVMELPGMEFFPDTQGRVLGTKSEYLPPILTT